MTELSIIVPMYNGEATIGRCLDSLIGQTLQELEILVVDDGSTDRGAEIVQGYMERDSRVRMVYQENRGQGAARNLGIRKAAGRYVGFVDSDDYALPEMYACMMEALRHTGCQVAVCQEKNVYVENGRERLINETRFPVETVTAVSAETMLSWQLNYTYMSLNSVWSKVIRRDLFFSSRAWMPENYRFAEDMVTSAVIFSSVDRVAVVPRSLYCYVHRKGSASFAYSLKQAEDIYLDWREIRERLGGSYSKTLDNFSLGMYFSSMKQFCRVRDRVDEQEKKRLAEAWERERREGKWKPCFLQGTQVPFVHKVKILAAWCRLVAPAMKLIRLLQWIPFFKYMS